MQSKGGGQPAIWMGDWGEVRIPIEPSKIERAEYAPHLGCVTAGGRMFEYTATAHAAWLRGDLRDVRLLDGYNANRDDENLGRALPNFKGWRCVKRVKDGLQIGESVGTHPAKNPWGPRNGCFPGGLRNRCGGRRWEIIKMCIIRCGKNRYLV